MASAFDAFFRAADQNDPTKAIMAFNQQRGAQQAFNQGGFGDFFKAADALAAGNAATSPDQLFNAGDALSRVLQQPQATTAPRVTTSGQAVGNVPPPPPPPPPAPTPTPAPVAQPGDPTAFLISGGRADGLQGDVQNLGGLVGRNEADVRTHLSNVFGGADINSAALANLVGGQQVSREALLAANPQAPVEINQRVPQAQQPVAPVEPLAPPADPVQAAVDNGAGGIRPGQDLTANPNLGLNTDILSRLADLQGLQLQSDDALRRNQQTLQADFINQADAAGRAAVEGLGLQDITATNIAPRTLSPLEQAIEQRAMQRLTGGNILAPDTDLVTRAETTLMDRLLGGDSALLQNRRASFLDSLSDTEAQTRETLNRLGVLRSGDTAEALGDLANTRERGLLDIAAQGDLLQNQAIQDALSFQGRRDNLALAEQDLQRAAISDARGIADTRNNLDLAESQLSGVLRGEATLPARLAQAQFQQDAARLQQDVSDRTLARLQTQLSPTGREAFEESIRQARVGEGLAGSADRRADQALQSALFGEVAGEGSAPARRTLEGRGFDRAGEQQDFANLLAQAGLTGDFRGQQTLQGRALGSDLQTQALSRSLAQSQDQRASRLAQQDILSQILNRDLARSGESRAQAGFEDDLLTSGLNRQLATSADTRAGEAQDFSIGSQRIAQALAAADPQFGGAFIGDSTVRNLLSQFLLGGEATGGTRRGLTAEEEQFRAGSGQGDRRTQEGEFNFTDQGLLRALIEGDRGIDRLTPRSEAVDRQIMMEILGLTDPTDRTGDGGPTAEDQRGQTPGDFALNAEEILMVRQLVRDHNMTEEEATQTVLRIRDR